MAGINVQFNFSEDFYDLAALDKLHDFSSTSPVDLTIEVQLFPKDQKPCFPLAGTKFPMFDSEHGLPHRKYRILILNQEGPEPHGFAKLSITKSEGKLEISQTFSSKVSIETIFNPFYISIIVNLLLFDHDVIPVQCNAVTFKNKAILLLGHSGAGKTTLTNIVKDTKGFQVLSDDQAYLRLIDGRWWLFPSPRNWAFRRYFLPRAKDPRIGYELGTILILKHGEKNEFRPHPSHRFMRMLLDQTFSRSYDSLRQDRYFDCLVSICDQYPCYEYYFQPTQSSAIELSKFNCEKLIS